MEMLEKYARLLVDYCLEIREGDRLLIRTTTAAEPLVREAGGFGGSRSRSASQMDGDGIHLGG